MNRSDYAFITGNVRSEGSQLCLLLSFWTGALLTLAETRAATFTLRYDQTVNQTSQQTAVTVQSRSTPHLPMVLLQCRQSALLERTRRNDQIIV